MFTTQTPGLVGCVRGEHLLDERFEDIFQSWLVDALGITSENVRPAVELDLTALPALQDAAVFLPTGLTAEGIEQDATDEGTPWDYSGQLSMQVTLCGPHARALAILLCDTFSVEQNCEVLHKALGLGFVNAAIQGFTLEQRGQMLVPRADVMLTFNYQYRRIWGVLTILEPGAVNFSTD